MVIAASAIARVRVLDTKPELPAVVPREEPVEEERAHAADVKEPGGRWGKSGDNFAGHIRVD
jgi:hypothetical protein